MRGIHSRIHRHVKRHIDRYRAWRFRNTSLLVLSFVAFIYFADSGTVRSVVAGAGQLGYVGAIIAGFLSVSLFTIAPATVLLFDLADTINPFLVALFAGLGAVGGDYLLFRFVRNSVVEELGPVVRANGGQRIARFFSLPHMAWTLPFVGALALASPLPDELGVGLMGVARMQTERFLVISFLLNAVGILSIVTLARSL